MRGCAFARTKIRVHALGARITTNTYVLRDPPPPPRSKDGSYLQELRAAAQVGAQRHRRGSQVRACPQPAARSPVLLPRHACGPPERLLNRSWDEKQRERSRLARLAMLERDNHHTDNTHMMKVQNLADDEIVGGGVLGSAA